MDSKIARIRIQADPFYEYRKKQVLPEKYESGMNCFLDTIADVKMRQKVFEDLKRNPNSYKIIDSANTFGDTGLPVLFGVKANYALTVGKRIPDYGKTTFGIDKKKLIRLMLERPDVEMTSMVKAGERKFHAVCFQAGDIILESEPWLSKATEYFSQGKYKETIIYCDRALEVEPLDARAWLNKGVALDTLGESKDSIRCIDQALEIAPNFVAAWLAKACCLAGTRDHQGTIACCDKVININVANATAWCYKAGVLVDEYFNKWLKVDLSDESLWKQGLSPHQVKCKEAVACCDKALEINPSLAIAWDFKALALYCLARFEEGNTCLNKALELEPKRIDWWKKNGLLQSGFIKSTLVKSGYLQKRGMWLLMDSLVASVQFSLTIDGLISLFIALVIGIVMLLFGKLSLQGLGVSLVNSYITSVVVLLFLNFFLFYRNRRKESTGNTFTGCNILTKIALVLCIVLWITILTEQRGETFFWLWR